jgi:tRNA nucleotidyltransferase (CCA-adding enzyme)
MKIYLVGGAVRDKLLNLPVRERDWVVIGARPEDMQIAGFKPVGKDFPVYLHPKTREEYALARTERKTSAGYRGFNTHASPNVTLEEDLRRRDLTINALAEDQAGRLIDPFGGREDLERRILRHVSPAFAEDPVRILRAARFAARFKHLGFRIANETYALMRHMVEIGEVDVLVAERVWQELAKALREKTPAEFFEVLRNCGALSKLFPEIDNLFDVPQPPQYHPEIDAGVHTMLAVTQAAILSPAPQARFAALTHDLGKATTPRSEWPSHRGHAKRGVELVDALCDRLRVPKSYRELAKHVARYHLHCHRAQELRSATLLKVLDAIDSFRRPERFDQFLIACEADWRGRLGFEDRPYPQAELFRGAREAAIAVDTQALVDAGLKGEAIARVLREHRIAAIKAYRKSF